jgi:hypothetical protein
MEYAPFVAAGLYHMVEKGRKEAFFFEKKNLKTFIYKGLALPRRVYTFARGFCFFFQKDVLPS